MESNKIPTSHLCLSFTAIICEYCFLILSPSMYKAFRPAFWFYLIGHFILSCCFDVNEYLVDIILTDEFEPECVPLWRVLVAIAIAVTGLVFLVYVLIKCPVAFVIQMFFEVLEQGVTTYKRKLAGIDVDDQRKF